VFHVAASQPIPASSDPADIAARRFALVRKGYAPEEVDRYLRQLSEEVSRLRGEVEWQRARSEHLERRTTAAQEAAYARLSRDFMEVVRRADEAAGRVRTKAEVKARAEVEGAHREAARLLAAATEQAEAILTAALAETERIRREGRSGSPGTETVFVPEPEPNGPLPQTQTLAGLWRDQDGPGGSPDRGDQSRPVDLDGSLFDLFDDPG
jgi:DivIVA domain-containing protein